MPISNPPAMVMQAKEKRSSRTGVAASGSISYTGIGFKPRGLIVDFGSFVTVVFPGYRGFGAAGSGALAESNHYDTAGTFWLGASILTFFESSAGNRQSAVLSSYDADGFTLVWTKTGTPGGEASLVFLAMR